MSKQLDNKDQDQADELRELFNTEENIVLKSEEEITERVSHREIDVLNLPPRKEVHGISKRTKLKVSKPFWRFVLISLLVIVILVVALYLWDGEIATLLNQL